MYITLDRDYEIKCTLGTIKDIETRFNKPFFTLVSGLDKLTSGEHIKLLYLGAKRADPNLSETAFTAACEDKLGLGELTDYLEQFVFQLQYPGLSGEEIQERLQKKLLRAESIKVSTGAK